MNGIRYQIVFLITHRHQDRKSIQHKQNRDVKIEHMNRFLSVFLLFDIHTGNDISKH